VARLEKEPRTVTLKDGDEAKTARIDADLVRLLARHRAGRRTRASEWPEMIAALDRGDYALPASAVLDLQTIRLDEPMHYSMDCASGISPARRKRYQADPAQRLLGDLNWEYESLCDLWPAENLGDAFRADVVSDIPTVLIHGTWDTSTPIENAREVLKGLRRGRLVEVDAGNHGALHNLYERWPPMRDCVRDFLTGKDSPFPATVDDSSVIQFKAPAPPAPAARPAGSR
jgi:pimeloyl-ACP methyl ester carboxylesterase